MNYLITANLIQVKVEENKIALLDTTGIFEVGDMAYSVDIEFYEVTKADIKHANDNHWKLIAILDKEIEGIETYKNI